MFWLIGAEDYYCIHFTDEKLRLMEVKEFAQGQFISDRTITQTMLTRA